MGQSGEKWEALLVFIGEYDHKTDSKNRLSIPRKFRDVLKASDEVDGFYVTRGLDQCLFLFTGSQWDEVTGDLRQRAFTDSATRRFQRLFFSNASFCELDNQGRILIPDKLRAIANLAKEVTVVGVYSRVEVWSRSRWNAIQEADGGEYEVLAEQLF